MNALLSARSVDKRFQNGDDVTQVLKGIDLELRSGELVALVGASGSGKSTLLSILGLLLRPSAGEIWVNGERIDDLPENKRAAYRNQKLGFIFQAHHLLPDFSALENVALPAAAPAGGISKSIRARSTELLGRVGLEDRMDFRATRLSGGQKQRVAIARSLINGPLLVLADEPTGNLDRESADQVLSLMREMNRQDGVTFLICTHDEHVASQCSRRIVLVDGRVGSESSSSNP
ncbi:MULTISPECIES: ABC transporter ATP-binding protein [unclassified Phenylobacterium]|uniref:ABC transporter ATP-binding protein n=1 Tax=unclassified Phenylobacterium TaxID=2640670 RepID=UPI0022B379ED|nr:ABC transporter ATP-binding protein [Phenylobacterium sp. NIBR 498073]MBS0488931.1 ABC transporter ATP-binding protein [Pseudomonadota bacterium]WGU41296.1 ABC transporter ATP-binding protein [Phenylobacterium sp. NIBR 498073]